MKPLVSIIIPTYNRAHVISETLECVSLQDYPNWECIIVDDGSTDITEEIVKKHVDKDSRFQFKQRPPTRPKGASSCRNIGMETARGEYLQFLDSDDLVSPNKLTDQIAVLVQSKPLTIATCKWGRFNVISDLKTREGFKTYQDFNRGADLLLSFGKYNEFFPVMAYLIPKASIKLVGQWNESLNNNDDGEFFTRVLLNTNTVVFVSTAAVYYRENPNEAKLSSLNTKDKILSAIKSWKLIENHILKSKGLKKTLYVENAKKYILSQIIKKDFKIVLKNSLFFKNQLLEKLSVNKLIKKLF